MKNKAYSVLTIEKSFDDGEQRIIKGIASTPAADREGDIVDPSGITFQNPLPLLWQHNHDQPIGTVVFDKATPNGITFTATIAKVEEEGTLKTRCDEAWQSVKYQIVKGVSIGFRVLENDYEVMKSGGLKFNSIEVYELSIVTVPANQEASIKVIKAFDTEDEPNLIHQNTVEESEEKEVEVVEIEEQKESFSEKHINNDINIDNNKKDDPKPMNIAQQIKAAAEQLKLLKSNLSDVMQKSLEEQRSLNDVEAEQYDSIKSEIVEVEKSLARLKDFETTVGVKAETEIKDVETAQHVSKSASWSMPAQPKRHVEKGVKFARLIKCQRQAKGDLRSALEHSKHYSDTPEVHNVLKAMVETGTTTNADYSALVDYQAVMNDFIEFLRDKTIIDKMEFRYAPFNTLVKGQDQGATGYFVGQAAYKPVTSQSYFDVYLKEYKLASIITISDELLRRANPRIDVMIRDDLAAGLQSAADFQFLNPLATGKENVSPASVTHGATSIAASGTTGQALKRDISKLRDNLQRAGLNDEEKTYLVMSGSQKMAIENLENAIGNPVFPELQQGKIGNIPVITSIHAGDNIFLIKSDEIYMNRENIVIDTSREASVIMSSDPNNDTGVTPVSLWQTNQTGYLAEQYVNWQKRRELAVQTISGANYGGDVTGE